MPEAATNGEYSREQARRAYKLTARQLRSWERQGLLRHTQTYTFSDLRVLQALARLRQRKVPAAQIRKAVLSMRALLGQDLDPLRDFRIVIEGRRITVQVGSERMEPVSGQLLFDFDASEISRLLAFPDRTREAPNRRAADRQRLEAERWFREGLERERTGLPMERIVEAYEKAVELDPSSAGAQVNLGTVYFNARRFEQAEVCYRRAIEADPGYALAHFNLGNLLDERGDAERAAEHYCAALKVNPEYGDAHYNLALLYQTRGEVMNAVRHWKAYLKLDPGSTWAVIARRELDKLRGALVRIVR